MLIILDDFVMGIAFRFLAYIVLTMYFRRSIGVVPVPVALAIIALEMFVWPSESFSTASLLGIAFIDLIQPALKNGSPPKKDKKLKNKITDEAVSNANAETLKEILKEIK